VFITDFIGSSNVSDDKIKQAHVYNVNGTLVDMREKHPEVADLSIFVGDSGDIPNKPFGDKLPNRRDWAKEYFEFSGYILPFEPTDYSNRLLIREKLGIPATTKLILVTVGGTSAGRLLIERYLDARKHLVKKVPDLQTIILCGPRIESTSFGVCENVEFKPFVSDPIQYFAACDLAVIQGGLSTSMELTALGRPFIYFPLENHFEQQEFVPFRLDRYNAGHRMAFEGTNAEDLAHAVIQNLGETVKYKDVDNDGAKKAASMILRLVEQGESS